MQSFEFERIDRLRAGDRRRRVLKVKAKFGVWAAGRDCWVRVGADARRNAQIDALLATVNELLQTIEVAQVVNDDRADSDLDCPR